VLASGYSPDPRVIGSTCGAGDFPGVASKCVIDRVMAAPPLRMTENDARFDARTREVATKPGILPEILDRIFEPFFTTRRGQGGTGLGLALCQEYAARMQSRVSLWTAPGRGACFRVHMPRQADARSGLVRRARALEP
jgi:nitrogen-specific signal transduction histidine kinase